MVFNYTCTWVYSYVSLLIGGAGVFIVPPVVGRRRSYANTINAFLDGFQDSLSILLSSYNT